MHHIFFELDNSNKHAQLCEQLGRCGIGSGSDKSKSIARHQGASYGDFALSVKLIPELQSIWRALMEIDQRWGAGEVEVLQRGLFGAWGKSLLPTFDAISYPSADALKASSVHKRHQDVDPGGWFWLHGAFYLHSQYAREQGRGVAFVSFGFPTEQRVARTRLHADAFTSICPDGENIRTRDRRMVTVWETERSRTPCFRGRDYRLHGAPPTCENGSHVRRKANCAGSCAARSSLASLMKLSGIPSTFRGTSWVPAGIA